jgi:hypothetical protein
VTNTLRVGITEQEYSKRIEVHERMSAIEQLPASGERCSRNPKRAQRAGCNQAVHRQPWPGPFLRVALMQFKDPQPNPIVVCRTGRAGRAAFLDRRVAPSFKEPCDCLAVLAVDGSQFLDNGLSYRESIWAIACMGSGNEALKRKGIFHHSRTGTSSKSVGTNVSDATDTTRNTLLSFFQE